MLLPWDTTELEPKSKRWIGSTIVVVLAATALVFSWVEISTINQVQEME